MQSVSNHETAQQAAREHEAAVRSGESSVQNAQALAASKVELLNQAKGQTNTSEYEATHAASALDLAEEAVAASEQAVEEDQGVLAERGPVAASALHADTNSMQQLTSSKEVEDHATDEIQQKQSAEAKQSEVVTFNEAQEEAAQQAESTKTEAEQQAKEAVAAADKAKTEAAAAEQAASSQIEVTKETAASKQLAFNDVATELTTEKESLKTAQDKPLRSLISHKPTTRPVRALSSALWSQRGQSTQLETHKLAQK